MSLSTRMSGTEMGQFKENRRALIRLYTTYTLQYAAFTLVLAGVFVAEVSLLGSATFPEFAVYPLLLATIVPCFFSFQSTIFWWRVQNYALSLRLDGVPGDSLVRLNQLYQSYVDEHSSRWVLQRSMRLDSEKIIIITLAVLLLFLPISYYIVTASASTNYDSIAAVLLLAAILIAIILFVLRRRRDRRIAHSQIEESIARLVGYSEQFGRAARAATELTQYAEQAQAKAQAKASLGDLADKIMADIDTVGRFKESLQPEQKEKLTSAINSLTTAMITLNLTAQAGRVYAAYRTLIPGRLASIVDLQSLDG